METQRTTAARAAVARATPAPLRGRPAAPIFAEPRPTRAERPAGGRRYIGPKAQTTVEGMFFERTFNEAGSRGLNHTDVWREVLYAGLLATGRANRAEIEEACAVAGIDASEALPSTLTWESEA